MKQKGISVIGIIVFIALIAAIAWGLNYIITKDYVLVRTPITVAKNSVSNLNETVQIPLSNSTASTTGLTATSSTVKNTTDSTASTTTNTTTKDSELTVTYSDKGFSPASLTVKKGQTVTFVNESAGKMWVAANPFPSSSEYPAFNEKEGIANGESWSFTFDKSGVWFYHNHFSPAKGGKIVVNAK